MTDSVQNLDITTKQPELEALAAQALDLAKQMGATDAEIGVSLETGLSVSARCGAVETLEYQRDRGLGVSVYIGQQQGHASTSDFSAAAVKQTVKAACDIARATQADTFSGLAPAELMATQWPNFDLYHPWNITPDDAIELAVRMDKTAREFDARISNSDGASVDTGSGLQVSANSRGFLGVKHGTQHSLSCSVIAGQDQDMQRDYEYSSSRLPQALLAPEHIGQQAAEKTLARLGAQHVQTGNFPVLFRADVARGIIGHALGAISGGALYRDASFLKDQLGQSVFIEGFDLIERPHLHQGHASSGFDGDGLATPAERHIFKNGILETYLLSVYSARKLGLQPTAHAGGARNLMIPATHEQDLAALCNTMGTGLLVTELMGQGVNTVTGDYSRGAAGFWVENGVIAYPIKEATIAGKLQDMFKNIAAIGCDYDTRGNLHMGSLLMDAMTIAGEG